ncbi:MAG: hypothetical protein MZV70_39680 [Desulfobacterales bacterium]|nr:hypothetical protein [Desulfobacterales bacterium]
MTSFSAGNYDFLLEAPRRRAALPLCAGRSLGAPRARATAPFARRMAPAFRRRIAARIAGAVAKAMGMSYYQFLDNIETHYFFPLAIAKDSELSAGTVSVLIRPVTGKFDQAGGLAFGIRNRDNYFVVRINALEGNICLFEFRNGRRHKQVVVERTVDTGVWHRLAVGVEGTRLEASFNGEPGDPLRYRHVAGGVHRAVDHARFNHLVRSARGRHRGQPAHRRVLAWSRKMHCGSGIAATGCRPPLPGGLARVAVRPGPPVKPVAGLGDCGLSRCRRGGIG